MNEKIIHTECDCLWSEDCFDDNCRKRWFLVNDIEGVCFKYIGVCNQHIYLLIEKEVMKHDRTWSANRRYIYSNIIEKILSEYVILGNSWSRDLNNNDLANTSICFSICDRPHIYRYIKLIDCIELFFKNNSCVLREEIINSIITYLERKDLYKKYKTKYKESLALCRKLRNSYGKQKENIINQIFINILEMNIKTKTT